MPYTLNGVGTAYYGTRNLRRYQGQCEFCNRYGELQEYDTIYWFVVLFVPVIPLGRKQILCYCTGCHKHRMASLAKWEAVKTEAIAADESARRQNPDDPQAAIKLLHTLAAFNRTEEADVLAAELEHRFADNSDVQLHMGQWHEFRVRAAEADHCYRRALELDPESLAAKRAVAVSMMNEGEPGQALLLLAEEPDIAPSQDPPLYIFLAKAYQRKGQHADALAMFQAVIEAVPTLGFDKQVRKLVRQSERRAPGFEVLPKIPLHRARWAKLTAAASLVLTIVLLSNWYISAHRTLHVVNGFGVPLQVRVDEQEAVVVGPHQVKTVSLSEGHHQATVASGDKPLGTENFDIATDFFARFFKSPVFVLNPSGAAVIVRETTVYSRRPANQGSSRAHAGEPFLAFDDVDLHFQPFPRQVHVKQSQTVAKTRVGVLETDPENVLSAPADVVPWQNQLRFAEAHLGVNPDDKRLLQSYANVALARGQTERLEKFLEPGLAVRPVRIEWHRLFQQFSDTEAGHDKLVEKYSKLLAADPTSGSLVYLRGRLEQQPNLALEYYDRAIAADPANPYPLFAKGSHRMAAGEFAEAKTLLAKAAELRPDDPDFASVFFDARFALREYDDLARDLQAAVDKSPKELDISVRLYRTLLAQGKFVEATQLAAQCKSRWLSDGVPTDELQQIGRLFDAMLSYDQEKFAQLLTAVEEPGAESVRPYYSFIAQLESGHYDQAAAALEANPELQDGYKELSLSVGWRTRGDEAQADQWQTKACEQFEHQFPRTAHLLDLLRNAPAVSMEEARSLVVAQEYKSVVLVALAQHSPEHADELLDLAERLNYLHPFRYHFARRAIAAVRAAN